MKSSSLKLRVNILLPKLRPPYPMSLIIGCPRSFRWTLIWWVLPVTGTHSNSEVSESASYQILVKSVWAGLALSISESSGAQHANTASFMETQYWGYEDPVMSLGKSPCTLAKYVFETVKRLLASWNSFASSWLLEKSNKPDVRRSIRWSV